MSFAYMTALELKGLLAERSISPVELVEDTLSRQDALEPQINAFVNRTPEQALAAAREAERAIGRRRGGCDCGPCPSRSRIWCRSRACPGPSAPGPSRTTWSTSMRHRWSGSGQAGGCIIGKSTTSEFGCKAVCDSPLSGITRNPWDLTKTSGGSSGGAGASVAAGLTPFALGTDGGGSVRIPSALCGLFGIKGAVRPGADLPGLGSADPRPRGVDRAHGAGCRAPARCHGGPRPARCLRRRRAHAGFPRCLRCGRGGLAHRLEPDPWLRAARA